MKKGNAIKFCRECSRFVSVYGKYKCRATGVEFNYTNWSDFLKHCPLESHKCLDCSQCHKYENRSRRCGLKQEKQITATMVDIEDCPLAFEVRIDVRRERKFYV